MTIPTGNLDDIRASAASILAALARRTAQAASAAGGDGDDLPVLQQAFGQLFEVMARAQADRQAAGDDGSPPATGTGKITELGEYAFRLHENLAAQVSRAIIAEQQAEVAALAVDLALWIARQGGQIDSLEPVVDALARLANTLHEAPALEALSGVFEAITAAVSPVIREDLEKINPGRPWRLLLLNRGIVATRSHNTSLMEASFTVLTQYLPEDAARFFNEGMQQMDALNYPPRVREVMEKYHRRWPVNRSLH